MLVRSAFQGAVAGVVATGAMTTVMEAGRRLGGMERQPPKRIVRAVLPAGGPKRSRTGENGLTVLAHAGFGVGAGALFGALTGRRMPPRTLGVAYALAVWGISYQQLVPSTGAMPPIDRDHPGRAATMAAAHIVYGWVLATSLRKARVGRP